MDGAILSKMADRPQIVGGIVDGPLDAARIKHIDSPVAGAADVLAVPNIEAIRFTRLSIWFTITSRSWPTLIPPVWWLERGYQLS
jgi:phosphate acetyltransferase